LAGRDADSLIQPKPLKLDRARPCQAGGIANSRNRAGKIIEFWRKEAIVTIVGQNPVRLQSAESQPGDGVTLLHCDVSKPAEIEAFPRAEVCLRLPGQLTSAASSLSAFAPAIKPGAVT
jgi:hypothetical protein